MKVNIVLNKYSNLMCFKSKVVYTNPLNCFSESERQYIDDFEENKTKDAIFLGE